MSEFWWRLDPKRRIGLVAGLVFVVALVAVFSAWVFRVNHSVLFSSLDDQDAAQIVEQLESMKAEYRLIDQGSTITVPDNEVHAIRLKLTSSGVLLKGGVGFELFDEAEYGMTDFAQKINYQRALQGELARTIGSLQKVQHARVHLVLPDSSLFRKKDAEPSAAITVILGDSGELTTQEILGIQRLVAASIQGLSTSRIVIVNERGEVLSNTKTESAKLAESQLDERLQLEAQLREKAQKVVDSVFGAGNSVVNVTLSINYDRIQRRFERELPVIDDDGNPLVSRSATTKSVKPTSGTFGGQVDREGGTVAPATNEVSEMEYRFGKSVEEQVLQTGNISRMSISVLVPGYVDEVQIDQIRRLIAASVALDVERGDVIEVVAMAPASFGDDKSEPVLPPAHSSLIMLDDPVPEITEPESRSVLRLPDAAQMQISFRYAAAAILVAFLFVVGISYLLFERRRRPRLTPMEREQYLVELSEWLSRDSRRIDDEKVNSDAAAG